MEKDNELRAVQWITDHRDESPPVRSRRDHADPTADAAIGHIMAEQRRRNRPKKKHPRVGVWRAEESQHDEENKRTAK